MYIALLTLAVAFASQPLTARSLTVEDVIRLAKQDAPAIRVVNARAEASQYEAQSYLAEAFPKLDFNYDLSRQNQSLNIFQAGGQPIEEVSSDNYRWALRLEGPLYTFGRVGALYTMYRAGTEKVKFSKNASVSDTLRSIIVDYVAALNALKNLEVQKTARERARNNQAFVELEFRGGAIKRTDLISSTARLQEAEAVYYTAEASARDATDRLKLALGMAPDTSLELKLDQNVDTSFFKTDASTPPSETPALKALRLEQEFAEADAKRAKAEYYPQIGVFAQIDGLSQHFVQPDNIPDANGGFAESFDDRWRNSSYGLSFKWNLFAGGKTYANSNQQSAKAMIARIEYETAQRRDQIAKQSQLTYLRSSQKVYEANLKAVEASRLNYETSQSEFKNGAKSLTELFEEEEDLIRSEQRAISSFGDLILSIVDFRINYGREITPL